MWNGTMFVDLDWPLNASSLLSASAELLVAYYYVSFVCSVSWLFLLKLSVPVQVIDWKDSSPKWLVMCWWGRLALLSQSPRLVMYSVLAGLCISGPYSIDKMRRYGWLWQMCEMLSLQLVTVFILVETVLNIFISVSFCMYRKHIIITCSLFTHTGVVNTLMYRYCRRRWGQ